MLPREQHLPMPNRALRYLFSFLKDALANNSCFQATHLARGSKKGFTSKYRASSGNERERLELAIVFELLLRPPLPDSFCWRFSSDFRPHLLGPSATHSLGPFPLAVSRQSRCCFLAYLRPPFLSQFFRRFFSYFRLRSWVLRRPTCSPVLWLLFGLVSGSLSFGNFWRFLSDFPAPFLGSSAAHSFARVAVALWASPWSPVFGRFCWLFFSDFPSPLLSPPWPTGAPTL